MAELPVTASLRSVGGLRYETTDLAVDSAGEREGSAVLEETTPLPAFGLIYEIVPDMNLRVSYGRTLARPTYREITPISVFDVSNRETLVGNPDLSLTSIDNFDLRWEWFPRPGEVLAASVFYKALADPIQKTTATANRQVQYQNREEGIVYGLELEARKNLGFVRSGLEEFTMGGNVALVHSEVDKGPFDYGEGSVPLAGQSPYIVNVDLTWHHPDTGTTASVFYNVFGPRLFSVGQRETPHILEQPVHTVDFTLSRKLSERWSAKFKAENLADPLVRTTYDFGGGGGEYLYPELPPGPKLRPLPLLLLLADRGLPPGAGGPPAPVPRCRTAVRQLPPGARGARAAAALPSSFHRPLGADPPLRVCPAGIGSTRVRRRSSPEERSRVPRAADPSLPMFSDS